MTRLETYRTPKAMVENGAPQRVGKLFRDDDEIPASSDLGNQLEEALSDSEFLIVVCSPDTPTSAWVRREIAFFQEMGRGHKIIPLLVEGEPEESFPPELLRVTRTRALADGSEETYLEDVEPLAADVRPRSDEKQKDTQNRAFIRIAAALLRCRYDDLEQRDQQRKRNQLRRMQLAIVVGLSIVAVLTSVALYGILQANKEEQAGVAAALGEIEDRSRFLSKLALEQANDMTAMLIALDSWNVDDPRPDKQYHQYLQLPVQERLSVLRREWTAAGHDDPSRALAAAVVREKAAKANELFYREYRRGNVKVSFSNDRSIVGLGYEDGSFFVEDLAGADTVVSGQTRTSIRHILITRDNRTAHILTSNTWQSVDIESGEISDVYDFGTEEVRRIELSPNEKYAAVALDSGALMLVDIAARTAKSLIKFDIAPQISWPSAYLFVANQKTLHLIDLVNGGKPKRVAHADIIKQVRVNEDGKSIVVVLNNNDVHFIGVDGSQHTVNIPGVNYGSAHIESASAERRVYSSTGDDGILVRDYSTNEMLQKLSCADERIRAFDLSTDKTTLVAATGTGTVCVWNTQTFERSWAAKVSSDPIDSIVFGRESDDLLYSTATGAVGGVKWRRPKDYTILDACEDDTSGVFFGPNARYLFSKAGSMGLCRWDLHNDFSMVHMPSFTLTTHLLPFSKLSSRMVVTDRQGNVIEGSYPEMNEAVIYSAGDAAFRYAGTIFDENENAKLLGHAIDGTIYLWDRDAPTSPRKLSLSFSEPVRDLVMSVSNEFIVLIDSNDDGYIFDPVDGALVSKIDLPIKLISIAVDLNEQAIVIVLSDQRPLSIGFDEVRNLAKLVTSEASFEVFQPVDADINGVRMSAAKNSRLSVFDLASQHIIYSIDNEDVELPNLYYGSYRQFEGGAFIVGIAKDFSEHTRPKILVHKVPDIVGRVMSKQAQTEGESALLSTESDRRLFSSFWQSESEDWTYKRAVEMATRCLTPRQRETLGLDKKPPCWCALKPYPRRAVWEKTLGYDPFTVDRCGDMVAKPGISLNTERFEGNNATNH